MSTVFGAQYPSELISPLGHELTLRRQCTTVNTVDVMDLNMDRVNDHDSWDEKPL